MWNRASAILGSLRGLPRRASANLSQEEATFRKRINACIPVLLASPRKSDQEEMSQFLRETNYVLAEARTIPQASRILGHVVIPVLLYDPGFDRADGGAELLSMIGGWRMPSVVLLRDRAEAPAAAYPGVLDELIRPYRPEDVIASLGSAYVHWSLGRTRGCTAAGSYSG